MQEVDARHAGAVERAEDFDREPLHLGRHVAAGRSAGMMVCESSSRYLAS